MLQAARATRQNRDAGGVFSKNMKLPKSLVAIIAAIVAVVAFAQEGPANASPLLNAGAPSNGTSEIQTLTFGGTPSGGTFRLTFKGKTTAAISWSATNATLVSNIDTALEALTTIGTGGVTTAEGTMTAGVGTITVTFAGNLTKLDVSAMTVSSSLTGSSPTLANATTTAGVTATGRGAAVGRLLIDTTNAVLYVNAGTVLGPTWTIVGDQGTLSAVASELSNVAAAIPTAAVADLGAATSAELTGTLTGTVDGALANVADIALSTSDTYTDAAVNSAVNAAILDLNLQLKELQTALNEVQADAAADRAKVNDLLAKLRTALIVTP